MNDSAQLKPMPRIGDLAPDFVAGTTQGEIQFSTWCDRSWTVLFSHPADFTPVCSTELAEISRRHDDFVRRKTKLIGLSVDSIHSHLAWHRNLLQIFGVRVPFPIISDSNRSVAELYGMLHAGASSTATVRAMFVIDPARVVRALIYYPLNVGRNVDELLRLVDALQTVDREAVACPVNWRPGDTVVVPPPKTEAEVEQRLALAGVERFDFYLTRRALEPEREAEAPVVAVAARR
jgi:peroxiredoxin (alkyl hydroperoxide reductase subunit C)